MGRYIGDNALASVGSSYTLITFLTSVIIGLCLGSSAFISMSYGRKDNSAIRNGIYTSSVMIGILTLVIMLIFYIALDMMLYIFKFGVDMAVMICVIALVFFLAGFIWSYIRKCDFYRQMTDNTERMDKKYLVLDILNQIISNSIKYRKMEDAFIEIWSVKAGNELPQSADRLRGIQHNCKNTTLIIKDNGIGIRASDIANVFDKSFTGANGRIGTKSTGMGLYIAKNLKVSYFIIEALGTEYMVQSIIMTAVLILIVYGVYFVITYNSCKNMIKDV